MADESLYVDYITIGGTKKKLRDSVILSIDFMIEEDEG